jgi:hypothetical protein
VTVIVLVLLAVLAGYGLFWYEPWTSVTDSTANDALTRNVAPNSREAEEGDRTHTIAGQPYLELTGTFVSHQHRTTGTARLVRLPGSGRGDSGIKLELTGFDTTNGPDLRVWLSDQPVKEGTDGWRVFEEGRRVELGRLKGNRGDQVYDVPLSTDLTTMRSVTIWSRRFSVSYGAAALVTQP